MIDPDEARRAMTLAETEIAFRIGSARAHARAIAASLVGVSDPDAPRRGADDLAFMRARIAYFEQLGALTELRLAANEGTAHAERIAVALHSFRARKDTPTAN